MNRLSNENKYTASLIDDDKSILVKKMSQLKTSSPMENPMWSQIKKRLLVKLLKNQKKILITNDDDDNNMKPADQMSGGSLSLLQSLAEEVSDNLKKEDSVAVENNINFKSNEHKPDVKASKDSARENAKLEKESSKPKKIKRDRPHHPRDEVNDDQKLHIRAMAKKLKEEAQAKKDKETLKVISGEKMGRIPKIPKKQPVVEPPEKKEVKSPKPATNGSLSTESSSSSYKSKKVESSGDSPKTKKDVHNFHESTSFMDAIFSSMGQSDIPRKKRRRLSDKDESSSPKQSKTDPTSEKKKVEDIKESESDNAKTPSPPPVFSFYRDTLDDEPAKEEAKKDSDEINEGNNEDLNTKEEGGVMVKEASQSPDTSLQLPEQNKSEDDLPFEEPTNPLPREVKGILVYHRGKEKAYFELDETERVNVNKLKYDFKNMMKMEFEIEKAALKSKGTLEEEVKKTIQALREAEVLQAIYFSKESVPDTPSEVDSSELLSEVPVPPVRIPLDDKEGILEESVKDFSKGGWPIPKVNDIDRESSLENSFSLPPSLSNFLSSIGSNTLQAAQALAMQKMGMIPPVTATVTPQSEGVVFQPSVPHHPIQQRPQLHQNVRTSPP
ncbi:PPP1R10 [Lepeophtheirus salmonis]|uniref:PPP1R10 n=1 Tax=Lepeophtheirus salmonis TaxID=72036 RepID=A0A7R8CMU3_LEPSM|nr:PPP1R10 [Lepeophtheirus salmonis]CAF2836227.1 PPP1R10 [Lepeophtheirus salmonis]